MTADFGPCKVHPIAALFPLIEGDEFDQLVASIDRDGLQEPIVLAPDGKTIVDGRNRYLACQKAGRAPTYRTLAAHYTEPLIVAFIVATNIRRRHLAVGQRAMIGTEIERVYAEEAKQRQRESGGGAGKRGGDTRTVGVNSPQPLERSAVRAARDVGVGDKAVKQAKALKAEAPDLAKQVQQGTISLNDAHRKAQQREQQRARTAPPPDPKPRPAPVSLILQTHDGQAVPYPQPKSKATFNPTNDHISWAAWSWNPVTGCLHGCKYCYARELATRGSYAASYPVGFTPLFHHERLDAPANTKVPADAAVDPRKGRVFVCSMADLYGKWVPDEWISKIHGACRDNPQWEYLFLTKFPSRYNGLVLPETGWIGTSVDTQRRVNIAENAFRQINNVHVKWLSLEPLLEPLRFKDLSVFDWVVIGSQTETVQPDGVVPAFAPPFDWVARIVDQAREAGCRVYLKPNLLGETGPQAPGMQLPQEAPLVKAQRCGTAVI